MAADFNLSAEISVQLAKNAGVALQTQLKNSNVQLNVNTAQVKKAVKDAAKAAKAEFGDEITAVVKLNVDKADKAAFLKLFDPKEVDVKLNFKFDTLAADLDKSIKKILKDAGIAFDKTAQKANSAAAKVGGQNKKGSGVATGGAKQTAAQVAVHKAQAQIDLNKRNKKGVDDLISALRAYNTAAVKSKANTGKFLPSVVEHLDYLEKIVKGRGGITKLYEVFSGLGTSGQAAEDAAKNLSQALVEMYKQKENLNKQDSRVNKASGLLLLTPEQVVKQKAIIDKARNDIESYLFSFDAANPQAFRVTLKNIVDDATSSVGKALRDSEKDVRDYTRLITNLKQQIISADFNGATAETKNVLKEQLRITEQIRANQADSPSTQVLRSDPGFMAGVGDVESLKQADRVYASVDASLSSIVRKAAKSGLNDTYGGQLIGLEQKLKDIRMSTLLAQKAIRASNVSPEGRARDSGKVGQEGKEDASVEIKKAETLTLLYSKLENARNVFAADKLNFPVKELDDVIIRFDSMARASASLDDLRKVTEKGLIDSQQLAKDEAGLNRMLLALDRVKTGLNSAVTDYSNIGQKISDIENTLFADVKGKKDPRATKDSFNQGLFDVRQANAYNLAVDKTVVKLSELGDKAKTQFAANIYKKQARDFEAYAKTVVSKTPDINKALRDIRVAGDHAIFAAKYDATGGFFGQIAEAAGLATKRLGAFLFFAQGLYKIQNAMEQSLSAAVALDKELSKFEQIFNKSITGAEALGNQLSSLEKTIFNLAKNYGFASTEIAGAGKILAQAGILGVDLSKSLESITKASLGPTFEDMGETAETTIAIMNQFNKTGSQMESILGGISAVAAKYPVEAEGITAGVRRAGGAFATAGATIEDFTAAFTIVKQRTREADETVATSLRNIAISLQSVGIQDFVKNTIGAELLDKEGKFLGFTESIEEIGKAVERLGISSKDPRFAALVEGIAGKRQFTRLLPLIEDYRELAQIKEDFFKGGDSLNSDVAVALDTIENKLVRAREAVTELFTEIIRSDAVSALVTGFTFVTKAVTGLIRTLVSLQGAILGIATVATIFPKLGVLSNFFLSQITGGLKTRGYPRANKGGFPKYSTGGISRARGFQPGGGPNKDSFLAELTTREYVVQRPAVEKYGVPFMDKLNSGKLDLNDLIAGRNSGGIIGFNKGGVVPGFVGGGSTSGFGNVLSVFLKKLLGIFSSKASSGPDPSVSNALKSLGVSMSNGLASTLISAVHRDKTDSGSGGAFYPRSKEVVVDPKIGSGNNSRYLKLLGHEVGHAVTRGLNKSQLGELDDIIKDMPDDFKTGVIDRTTKSGKYGAAGSSQLASNIKKELRADVFELLTKRARGESDPKTSAQLHKQLDKVEKLYASVGINAIRSKTDIPNIIRKQGGATTIGATGIATAIGAGPGPVFPSSPIGGGGGRRNPPIPPTPPNGPSGSNFGKLTKAFSSLSASGLKVAAAFTAITTAAVALAGATDEQRETAAGTAIAFVSGAASFFALKEAISVLLSVIPKGNVARSAFKFFPETSLAKLVSGSKGSIPTGTDDIIQSIRGGKKLPIDPNFKKSNSAKKIAGFFSNIQNFTNASVSKAATSKGATGTFTTLTSGTTAALKARRLASNAARGINVAGPGASLASAKAASGLVKNFNLIGIAATGAFAAFEYLTNKVEESANIQIESAKTEAEALKAFEKKRLAGGARSGARFAGGAISGALTGAALGSAFTPIGTAVGGFIGAIVGGLASGTNAFGALGDLVGGAFKKISSGIFSAIQTTGNYMFKFFDGMDNFIGFISDTLLGTDSLARKALAEERGKIGASNLGRLNEIANKKNKDGKLNLNDVSKAQDLAFVLAIAKAGQNKRNRSGTFDDFAKDIEPQIKLEAQRIKEVISLATPLEQVGLIAAAKKNGNDLVQYFKDNGVDYDLASLQAEIAFDKMGVFFATLTSSIDKANSRLDSFDVGFEKLTDVSSRQFVSDKSFDIIKNGFIPSNDGGALKALRAQIGGFDKELLGAIDLETKGAATSRRLQEGLLANPDLKLDTSTSTPSVVLDKFIKDTFEKASGELGSSELNSLFKDFVDSKSEEFEAAISATGAGGQIDVGKINGLLKEFSENLDKGALETARRINETNKRYATEYQNLAAQRLNIEQEIIQALNTNVDKFKTVFDIRNKASGLTDRELLPTKRRQAAALDSAKLNNILRGTGFNAGASPQALGSALIGSQQRLRSLENRPVRGVADNAAIQQKIALEKAFQAKVQEGLKFGADGGEIAALAMQEFEMAAERAAKSTSFLTNALLGTDEQLMSTVKGLYAQRRIEGAQNPQEAMSILANLSSSAREGLNNLVSSDPDAAARFQRSLGIGSSIVGSKEARNVEGVTKAQQEYQTQIIKSMQDQGNNLATSIENLKRFYTDQFTNMQNGINMFSAVVDKVAADIKAMPSVVKHEVAGKVEVNITGAGVLTSLSPALTELINNEVGKQMDAFGGRLQKVNQGLNVPVVRREF